jgi:hypothetical protein
LITYIIRTTLADSGTLHLASDVWRWFICSCAYTFCDAVIEALITPPDKLPLLENSIWSKCSFYSRKGWAMLRLDFACLVPPQDRKQQSFGKLFTTFLKCISLASWLVIFWMYKHWLRHSRSNGVKHTSEVRWNWLRWSECTYIFWNFHLKRKIFLWIGPLNTVWLAQL